MATTVSVGLRPSEKMDMNIVRKLFIRRQSITLENQKATTAGSGKETAGSLEPGSHQV